MSSYLHLFLFLFASLLSLPLSLSSLLVGHRGASDVSVSGASGIALYADERSDKKKSDKKRSDKNIVSGSFSNWSYSNYKSYNFHSFAASQAANRRIELKGNIDFPLLHAAVFYETNRQRKKYALPLFQHSIALERAAKGHSNDMVAYRFFSHTSRVRGKRDLISRIRMAGFQAPRGWAENIANSFALEYESGRPFYSPSQNGGYFSYKPRGKPILARTYIGFGKTVVKEWMNSPGHRANILRAKMKYLGCGVQLKLPSGKDDMHRFISTQVFAVR